MSSDCLLARSALLVLAAMALSGCGRSTATISPAMSVNDRAPAAQLRAETPAPDAGAAASQNGNAFYPLDLGNHWGYQHEISLYIVPTGGPPGPVSSVSDRHERDLVCVEQRNGNDYMVERTSYGGSLFSWVRYRQDGAGLYEADVSIGDPPVCASVSGHRIFDSDEPAALSGQGAWTALAATLHDPVRQAAYRAAWDRIQARADAVRRALEPGPAQTAAGGVQTDEITRLQYPLHRGAHWVIRASPLFESIVEGNDALDLAVGHVPAWRIRIDSALVGPDDRVHFWFSRNGFLKLAFHFEGIATDPSGTIIGVVIDDETETLDELSLSGGRFAAP